MLQRILALTAAIWHDDRVASWSCGLDRLPLLNPLELDRLGEIWTGKENFGRGRIKRWPPAHMRRSGSPDGCPAACRMSDPYQARRLVQGRREGLKADQKEATERCCLDVEFSPETWPVKDGVDRRKSAGGCTG